MARQFKIGDIPTSRILPTGHYHLRIASFEEATSKSGLFMYVLEFRVTAPEIAAGRAHHEYLVIGKRPRPPVAGASEEWARYLALDDPDGEDPLTQRYSSGLRSLKQILVAADHKLAGADVIDMDDVEADFNIANPKEQLQVGARIISKPDNKGRENNEITIYCAVEQQEAALESVSTPKQNAKLTKPEKAQRRPRTRQTVETSYDDDELE